MSVWIRGLILMGAYILGLSLERTLVRLRAIISSNSLVE